MANVAFLLNFPKEYKGGINYIKNLMYACSVVESDLKIFMFMPDDIEQEYIDIFSPFATIIKTKFLTPKSFPWFFEKVGEKLFRRSFFLVKFLAQYKIDVISHSNFFSELKTVKKINWIPDFQCIHYPQLWSEQDLKILEKINNRIVKYSDKVVVSSNDALKDFKQFAPDFIDKAQVLPFVSQPGDNTPDPADIEQTLKNHGITRKFFYLPNQFWSHKNHLVVFKALKELKALGLDPLLVTTGLMHDYRTNNETLNTLNSYVNDNNLSESILMLGLIPYKEVMTLFRSAAAVINPSFFEGWSSSVEEAKSIGQTIILSDIGVHKEQNPQKGIYFNPLDEIELARIMKQVMESNHVSNGPAELQALKEDLKLRTTTFGEKYINLVNDLLKDR
jgi:glycosyltransferase involved in cell wall biosynthesis